MITNENTSKQRVAQFEKVSFDTFKKDYISFMKRNNPLFTKCKELSDKDEDIQKIYDEIPLPTRGTVGSAGYDLYVPYAFILPPMATIVLPTGIKCNINENWMFMLMPRSSYGNKWRVQLDDTISIIDSDFYESEAEGHIYVQITNDCKLPPVPYGSKITGERGMCPNPDSIVYVDKGSRFCQGVFVQYGITFDDAVTNKRTGTSGSTGK